MVSLEEQEKVVFLNSQYNDNKELIDRLQIKLVENITKLDLSPQDLQDTQEYLQDKATLFRFLKQNNFDINKAHEQLLDTIAWRIQIQISSLSYKTSLDFYEPPVAYFHGQDKLGRPILFVRLKYFPKNFRDSKTLVEHIQDFACLVMEMSRKLTWDMTRETSQLVAQFTVVVNLQKAPLIPIDREIIQLMMMILESRYPGIVGTVNILNFSWLYQGVWSVIKYMLSQEAKDTINFTTVKDLYPVISPDNILQEMGGNDTFEWSLLSDGILQKYGTEKVVELPNTPPLSEDRSRSNSFFSRSSSSSDLFFDANDALPSIPLTPPITNNNTLTPLTPTVQTQPTNTVSPLTPTTQTQSTIHTQPSLTSSSLLPGTTQLHTTTSPLLGLRMGVDFLTSFIDTKPQTKLLGLPQETDPIPTQEPSPVIIVNTPIMTPPPKITRLTIAQDYLHNFLQHTLGEQKGWMYWALLYFMLRGPIEMMVQKSLIRVGSNHVKSTTLGITATLAAILGSSLSTQVSKYTRN